MIDALAGDIGHPDDVVSLILTQYELGLLCGLWICGRSLVEVMCEEDEAKVGKAIACPRRADEAPLCL